MSRSLTYGDFLRQMFQGGFTRVERDDRLLDVFVSETREKGIELWEHWQAETVHIVRVSLPFQADSVTRYALARTTIEAALFANRTLGFSEFTPTPTGL